MKILITLIGAAVLASGAYAATSLVDDSAPARTVSLPGATTGTTTADTVEDVSGPCDEAEHANDPECGGTTSPAPAPPAPAATTTEAGEDVSGPCDEAEHANDPRCTGGVDVDDEDHSGRGGDDDHGDDDHHEDSSGSNSGRG